jgi:hypothetical protein
MRPILFERPFQRFRAIATARVHLAHSELLRDPTDCEYGDLQQRARHIAKQRACQQRSQRIFA